MTTSSPLDGPISAIELSGRARKALKLLHVTTIRDLLLLDLDRVLGLQRYGPDTVRQIRRVRQAIGLSPRLDPSMAFSREVVLLLPLFAPVCSPIAPADLHQTFFPDDSVGLLDLPKRAQEGLARMDVCLMGDLLCASGPTLTETANFGIGSLRTVREAVLRHLKMRNGLLQEAPLETASWLGFVQDLLRRCIKNPRARNIIRDRLGLLTGKPCTLALIGWRVGFTRERVRQLEKVAVDQLHSNYARYLLAPFLAAADTLVKESGGTLAPQALAAGLKEHFGWSSAPDGEAVVGLLHVCHGGRAKPAAKLTPAQPTTVLPRECQVDLAPACRAFGVLTLEVRLKILMLLRRRPHSVRELSAATGQSGSRLSRHLYLMRSAGLLTRVDHFVYQLDHRQTTKLARILAEL